MPANSLHCFSRPSNSLGSLSWFSWFLMLASPLTWQNVRPSLGTVLPLLYTPILSLLSLCLPSLLKKSHVDYGFQNHLRAKDSKSSTFSLTSLLNSRLVCLTAYLTSFLPWKSNRYSKHIHPHQNMRLSFPPGALHPTCSFVALFMSVKDTTGQPVVQATHIPNSLTSLSLQLETGIFSCVANTKPPNWSFGFHYHLPYKHFSPG